MFTKFTTAEMFWRYSPSRCQFEIIISATHTKNYPPLYLQKGQAKRN